MLKFVYFVGQVGFFFFSFFKVMLMIPTVKATLL